MLVGVPKEIKDSEYRVGLVPSAVRELTFGKRHRVLVEKGAGLGAGLTDDAYVRPAPRSQLTRRRCSRRRSSSSR